MANADVNGREVNREQPEGNGTPTGTALVPVELAYGRGGALTNAPMAPSFLSSKPNSLLLLRALKRRWLLAATLGLLAATIAAVGVWFLMPMTYTASTFLFMSHRPVKIVGTEPEFDFSIFQRTQSALVRSRFVLNRALRQPNVAELSLLREVRDPIEWLETNLQVDFSQSPEIMRISLTGEKPQELATLVEAISAAYLDEAQNDEFEQRTKRLQRLKDVAAGYELKNRTNRQTYKQLAETVGSSNSFVLAFKQQMHFDLLSKRKETLINTKNKLLDMRIEAKYQQDLKTARPKIEISADMIDSRLDSDATVLDMQGQIDKLERDKPKVAKGYSDGLNNPAVKKLDRDKENLRQALQTLKQTRRPVIEEQFRKTLEAHQKEAVASISEQIVRLQETQKSLEAEIDRLGNDIKVAAKTTVDLESLKEEIDSTDVIAKHLKTMINYEDINLNMPARVTRRQGESADTRRAVKEDKQMMMAGAAGAGAMALVFLVIAYWEFLARRIVTGDDVVYGLGWRLVGAIPDIPNRHRRPRAGDTPASRHWSSLLTESVDAARTMLLRTAATEGLRTVMITSAVAGEGKTSLSCHLATSLARAGRRTLLIDGDLRRPSVHQMFDVPAEPGFAGLLRGELDLSEVIRQTQAQNLWIIPAGQCDSITLQCLAEGKFKPILERLKEQFDFVIVDSSPVLPVVDALEIGQCVDVVIFSLLRDVSRFPNVYAAYERMTSLGVRVIGAVVNGVRQDRYGYAYRYYYSYGYTK